MVVVVSVIGGSEKFLHGIVRSRKPPLMVPLYDNGYYYAVLLLRHLYDLA